MYRHASRVHRVLGHWKQLDPEGFVEMVPLHHRTAGRNAGIAKLVVARAFD